MKIEYSTSQIDHMRYSFDKIVQEQAETHRPDMPQSQFDWPKFLLLESIGQLRVYIVRVDKEFAGAGIYCLLHDWHFPDILTGSCDCINIANKFAGMGLARGLIDHAEKDLRMAGAHRMTQNFRHHFEGKKTPLFEKIGFEKFETIYVKRF